MLARTGWSTTGIHWVERLGKNAHLLRLPANVLSGVAVRESDAIELTKLLCFSSGAPCCECLKTALRWRLKFLQLRGE